KLSTRAVAALSGAVLLACGGAAQAANLLVNGSFEDLSHFSNQGADTMTVLVGDSTTMPGWTVFSNDVAWIGPTNPFSLTASPGGGSYFLDLSGYHAADGGVQQTIATVA